MENTTIRVDAAVTTFVHILKVEPQHQAKITAMLEEGIESIFSRAPGWISSNLHKSRDGQRVMVYAQWQDARYIEAVRQDPKLKPYMAGFAAAGEMETEMYMCDVSCTRHA